MLLLFRFMYSSVLPACMYYVTCVLGALGSQKWGLDPRTGVTDGCDHTTRLLGTKPRSSERATGALNC